MEDWVSAPWERGKHGQGDGGSWVEGSIEKSGYQPGAYMSTNTYAVADTTCLWWTHGSAAVCHLLSYCYCISCISNNILQLPHLPWTLTDGINVTLGQGLK
jgi:hypothetical protein